MPFQHPGLQETERSLKRKKKLITRPNESKNESKNKKKRRQNLPAAISNVQNFKKPKGT
jgi:hypothetical protein